MDKSKPNTLKECIEATRIHLKGVSALTASPAKFPNSNKGRKAANDHNLKVDEILLGLQITLQKLESIQKAPPSRNEGTARQGRVKASAIVLARAYWRGRLDALAVQPNANALEAMINAAAEAEWQKFAPWAILIIDDDLNDT